MTDRTKSGRAMSRRRMLRHGLGAVGAVGAVAALGLAAAGPADAQVRKASQKAAGYQGSPKGAQHCGNCRHFQPPSSCKTVDGSISANGWCRLYAKA
ncbi:high-potential iron-sulfur protein [Rhodovulum sp. PH10]|uniref:high-potential iron-sulfur protein n=1 Tax=Rhodovulum sp. PH10 TaxID=1187851 RepID=UPI0002EB9256|nr:high-potential iron-sulfur protein [Rhodovulum sp. PH10]